MNLETIAGHYRETGVWRDSSGGAGSLNGSISIRYSEDRLEIAYEDGSRQVSEPVASRDGPILLVGTLGNGRLLLGDTSLVLEYEADVAGRVEYNTDVWIERPGGFRRAGVIRQKARLIWFEAQILKQ